MGKKQPHRKKRSAPLIEALEPRVLFSADVFGGALDAPSSDDPLDTILNDAAAVADSSRSLEAPNRNQENDAKTDLVPDQDEANPVTNGEDNPNPTETLRHELVVVDTATPDYEQLVDDLLSQTSDTSQFDIVLLDASQDGISQITQALDGYQELDAVHLISHGSDGAVQLGGSTLNFDSLLANSSTINSWGNAFSEHGDFLIYGCNLAASSDGQSLVDAIGRLTGADVAASDDLTGNTELGGDWELEYQAGSIESDNAFSDQVQASWCGTFAAPTNIVPISTTDGGLSLNEDGGNDAYLIADDGGAILGGLTELTAEVRFSMESFPNSTNFFSYATNSDDNVFKFNIRDDGDLSVSINSVKVNSSAMDYRTLADGDQHTLSVTWNSTGGAWEMFVDGVSADSGSGLESGATLAGGGALVMGNDQDSVDGGYDPASEVAATLYDARLFNDVRTSAEIAANFDQMLANTESGMIANWTFNDLSTSGVIVDTVSGYNLTVQNVGAGGGFVTSTPELTFKVQENATDGTVIGNVTGIDPDAGDTLSYSLMNDAGGRFDIDSSSGEITVADGSLLDYEANSSHNITVRISDGGLTYDEVFTIQLQDINDDPINAGSLPTDLVFLEDTQGKLDLSAINLSDEDAGSNDLTLTITSNNGHLQTLGWPGLTLGGSQSQLILTGSLTDLNDFLKDVNSIDYEHATPGANGNNVDLITIEITDNGNTGSGGGGTIELGTVNIDVTAVNDAPTAANQTVSTNEDTIYTFNASDFNFSDIDGDTLASIQITSLETVGSLQLNGSDVTLNQAISKTDIDAGKLKFIPVADANGPGYSSFEFSVNDGTEYSASTYTMTVDVTAVDDAPGVTVPGSQSINEDTTLVFSSGNGNQVSVSEVDSETFAVTLSVENGTLTLAQTTNLTFVSGDGTSDATMIFVGETADVNAALEGMSFNPNGDFSGDVDLDVTVADVANFEASILSQNPISYWKMDETSGTGVLDETGGHSGSYENGVTLGGDGIAGGVKAPSFDGSDDYIEIAHHDDFLLDDGTVQLWFNTSDVTSRAFLFSKDSFGYDTGGHLSTWIESGELKLRLQSSGADYSLSGGTLQADTWHHVAVNFGSGGLQLYLDGQLVDSDSYTGGLGTTSGDTGNFEPIAIGASTQSSDDGVANDLRDYFAGQIDEVAIFGSTLNATEINNLYNAGIGVGGGASSTDSVTITVTNVEDESIISGDTSFSGNEGDAVSGDLNATDIDGLTDNTYFSISAQGSNGTTAIDAETGVWSFTPTDPNWFGTDQFTVTVTDDQGGTTDQVVSITLAAVNDDPTNTGSLPTDVVVIEDTPGFIDLSSINFEDVDAGSSLIQVTLSTSNGGVLTASSDFDVTVSGSGFSTMTLQGGISDLNNFFNSAFRFQYSNPTMHIEGDNADTIQITVNDLGNTGSGGGTNIDFGTVNVDITNVNDAPAGTDKTVVTNEDNDYAFTSADFGFSDTNDSPSDALANILITTAPSNGNLYVDVNEDGLVDGGETLVATDTVAVADIIAGRLKFKPESNSNGTSYDSFTFQVQDDGGTANGGGNTDQSPNTITIDVTAVTDLSAADDSFSTKEDTVLNADVSTNDSTTSGGTLNYALDSNAGNGAVVINTNGTFTYTPDANFNGSDSFTYTVTDSDSGESSIQVVNIQLTAVNDVPVISGDNASAITEDVDIDVDTVLKTSGTLLVTDPDVGESSFYEENIIGTYGGLSIDAAGNWNYVADNTRATIQQLDIGETLTDILTVRTADGTAHDINITINGTEDAPVIAGITTGTVVKDGTVTAGGLLVISDVDTNDNPIGFANVGSTPGDNGYGSFVFVDGAWTYTLNNNAVQHLDPGQSVTDTITYTASDGISSITITVTINGAEEVALITDEKIEKETEDRTVEISDQVRNETDASEVIEEQTPEDEPINLEHETVVEDWWEEPDGFDSAPVPLPPMDNAALVNILTDVRQSSDHNDSKLVAHTLIPSKFIDLKHLDLQPFALEKPDLMEMENVKDNDSFSNSLEELDDILDEAIEKEENQSRVEVESAIGVMLSLSAGFVSWVFRAGSLLASFMSVVPLWRQLDPLPILDLKSKKSRTINKDQQDAEKEGKNTTVEHIFDDEK